jgi:hypothetical protein
LTAVALAVQGNAGESSFAFCGKASIWILGGFLPQKGERLRNPYEALLVSLLKFSSENFFSAYFFDSFLKKECFHCFA